LASGSIYKLDFNIDFDILGNAVSSRLFGTVVSSIGSFLVLTVNVNHNVETTTLTQENEFSLFLGASLNGSNFKFELLLD